MNTILLLLLLLFVFKGDNESGNDSVALNEYENFIKGKICYVNEFYLNE